MIYDRTVKVGKAQKAWGRGTWKSTQPRKIIQMFHSCIDLCDVCDIYVLILFYRDVRYEM